MKILGIVMVMLLGFVSLAMGEEGVVMAAPAVVEMDWGKLLMSLVDLVKNWKVSGTMASISALIVILVQVMKSTIGHALLKKPAMRALVVLVLGQISGVMLMMANGMSVLSAMIAGLITSGGAVALYNAFKLLKK